MTTQLPPNDPDTNDGLPGEDELSALYRQLPQSEPAPALDAAVLAAAAAALDSDQTESAITVERRQSARESGDWVHPKHELKTTSHRTAVTRHKAAPRWLIGLSSAATLVLAAGLAWHMRDMPETNPKPVAAIEDNGPPQAAAPLESNASGVAPQAPLLQADKQANHLPPAKLEAVKPVSPVQSEERSRDSVAAYARNEASAKQQQKSLENSQATRRAVLQKRAASAPRQAASAEGALMAPAPPAVMEISAPTAAPQNEPGTSVQASDTPEQELAKIQRLVQQQHDTEARQRLQTFMQAHPKWDLPPDLRDLLKQP